MKRPETIWLACFATAAICLTGDAVAAEDLTAATDDSAAVAGEDDALDPDGLRWSLDFALGGGSVLGFTSPLSTGHSFWGGVWFNWDDFGAGLIGFGVYPGSRVQTRFGGLLLDFRWYFLGGTGQLRPFAALGLGFSGGDSLNGRTNIDDPIRWARNGSPLIVAPAVGLRWGADEGLFISAEARLINASHLTLNLGAGFSF